MKLCFYRLYKLKVDTPLYKKGEQFIFVPVKETERAVGVSRATKREKPSKVGVKGFPGFYLPWNPESGIVIQYWISKKWIKNNVAELPRWFVRKYNFDLLEEVENEP